MKLNFKLPALVALFLLPLVHGAFAQTAQTTNSWGATENTAQTMTRWGLTGDWAADCSVPPDDDHGRQSYKMDPNGRVIHERNFGNHSDQQEIVSAAISEAGILSVQEILQGRRREYGFMKTGADSVRVMYNRNEKNEYSVKEGLVVGSGKPVVVQHRCN